jgi:hypothetical protein
MAKDDYLLGYAGGHAEGFNGEASPPMAMTN